MPLDEIALRKPGFQEGVKATLADGQQWTFPRVKFQVIPVIDDNGSVSAKSKRLVGDKDCSKELNEFLDYEVDDEGFKFMEWMTKRLAAAASLLLVNYSLSGDNLAELLCWERDNEESEERWRSIDSAVMGITPKALAAGLN